MTNSKKNWEATASDEGFSGYTTLSVQPWETPADAGRPGAKTLVLVFAEAPFEEGSEEVEAYVLDGEGDMLARWAAKVHAPALRGSTARAARAWAAAAAQVLVLVGDVYDLSGAADLTVDDVRRALDF